jgi:four helix bundle protein
MGQNEIKTFESLEVWQKCRNFRKSISMVLTSFPIEEKYRLVDQLKRASRSVTANIAEGYGRFHYLDNIKFCRSSRGSLNEVLDHLICANDELLISTEELQKLRNEYEDCLKLLNGYIAYLKKQSEE